METRAELCRDEARLNDAWAHPQARWLGVSSRGRFAACEDGPWWQPTGGERPSEAVFLGLTCDGPRFALPMVAEGGEPRELLMRVSEEERPLYLAAAALIQWHHANPFCPRCGGQTEPTYGGWVRRCEGCDAEIYPRQDPAMIVAVRRGEELLLAHNASWPTTRRSLLAGFVEAGESFGDCVRREVREEVALELGRVSYLGSQSWPFPRSVMIAFEAEALPGDIVVDGVEVVSAQFYAREEFLAAMQAGHVQPPYGVSVAARLIQQWLDAEPLALSTPSLPPGLTRRHQPKARA